jgi:Predicted metalloprotease
MRRAQQRDPDNENKYSVMLELQADCYSGVWAAHATQTRDAKGQPIFTQVTAQNIQDAVNAAGAVGDDTIQRKAGRTVNPDSFTHGSSAQRQQWFTQGYQTGDPKSCNTFGGALGSG